MPGRLASTHRDNNPPDRARETDADSAWLGFPRLWYPADRAVRDARHKRSMTMS